MRVAEICSTCATYISAACILYNGEYLSTIDVSPLDSLETALGKINDAYTAQSGAGSPDTEIPLYIGQQYIDTSTGDIWIGLSTSGPNWGLVATYSTTTTTTTTSTTSTTTTAP